MPAKNIGERIDARCTHCGARAVTSAVSLKATGRLFGRCRQCGHDWVFRKNPLAS